MDVESALSTAVDEVLDKMAFLFFEELDTPVGDDAFKFITEVNVNGVVKGRLNILVSQKAAVEVARNLIGIREDDELYDETLMDSLKEFTNLVMGRTMTVLNPAGPFDMEVPSVVDKPTDGMDGHKTIRKLGGLDEAPICFQLHYIED